MKVGTIEQAWRYPFKSMTGESLQAVEVAVGGIAGDRGWAVRDEVRGGIRGAKKIAELMRCSARYPAEPAATKAGPAQITLPDGATLMSDDSDVDARLSTALGHEVTVWPLQPADKLDHYRRGAPTHEDLEQELRSVFALLDDEPLPDLSTLPPEVFEFESPPGTYFDAFPLLLIADRSLAKLQELTPESKIDVRRFRPNFVVAAGPDFEGFGESAWVGRRMRVGGAVIEVAAECPRCVMTTHAFDDLPKNPQIMRTLVRENAQNLGAYASVVEAGTVGVGDAVELL